MVIGLGPGFRACRRTSTEFDPRAEVVGRRTASARSRPVCLLATPQSRGRRRVHCRLRDKRVWGVNHLCVRLRGVVKSLPPRSPASSSSYVVVETPTGSKANWFLGGGWRAGLDLYLGRPEKRGRIPMIAVPQSVRWAPSSRPDSRWMCLALEPWYCRCRCRPAGFLPVANRSRAVCRGPGFLPWVEGQGTSEVSGCLHPAGFVGALGALVPS